VLLESSGYGGIPLGGAGIGLAAVITLKEHAVALLVRIGH